MKIYRVQCQTSETFLIPAINALQAMVRACQHAERRRQDVTQVILLGELLEFDDVSELLVERR